ncbi:thymidine kinase 2, mitochondrial isoform X1 [Octopus sinensis]|uniref:Thymidine kinase 2, mitochondrial isoform X1 n=1 Tax=Octopus sinensis TaxID=2607531 RepID=A0A6P7SHZ7_9MOLL|nr:thymidine kinase 2, mitochondrial isoform X1 [Octopus sinensis]
MFAKHISACRLYLRSAKILRSGYIRNFQSHQHSSMETISICVEGNIGAGKSEMLNFFAKDPTIEIISEHVKKWQNVNGHNMLDLMYKDPYRWGFTFQSYVQLTMLQNHMSKSAKPVQMMERSIYSAKYVFVENLYKSGLMPSVDYEVLTEWFNWATNHLDFHVDRIIYLRCHPETALERIKKRNRKEELNITLEYLQSLHEQQEEWLIRGCYGKHAEVLVLDAEQDLESMLEVFENSRNKILCL